MVQAERFLLEPFGAEFEPGEAGQLVIVLGNGSSRHRGVEVAALADGAASASIPVGARVFWLPDVSDGHAEQPWEFRLREIDQGTWSLPTR